MSRTHQIVEQAEKYLLLFHERKLPAPDTIMLSRNDFREVHREFASIYVVTATDYGEEFPVGTVGSLNTSFGKLYVNVDFTLKDEDSPVIYRRY